MVFLLFIFIVISFLSGYLFPKKMGWLLIITMPILSGIPELTIIPYKLPLKIIPVSFFVSIGILMSYKSPSLILKRLYSNITVKYVIIFLSILLLASLRDNYSSFFFSTIPAIFTPFILLYMIIESEDDINKLIKIMAWSSAIIGFFTIVEFFTIFNPAIELVSLTNPNYDPRAAYTVGGTYHLRSGVNRVGGMDLYPVFTAVKLAIFFPITLYYFYSSRNKLFGILPVLFTIPGLILTQSRAAILGLLIGLFYLIIKAPLRWGKRIIPGLFIAILISFAISPAFNSIFIDFFETSFLPIFDTRFEYNVMRMNYIWDGFALLKDRIFIGYGSPTFVYYILLNADDLIGPLLYALSGGIFCALFYLLFLFSMPFQSFQFSKSQHLNNSSKNMLDIITSALLIGVVVVFSNQLDRHFFILIMLFSAIIKVFYYNSLSNNYTRGQKKIIGVH